MQFYRWTGGWLFELCQLWVAAHRPVLLPVWTRGQGPTVDSDPTRGALPFPRHGNGVERTIVHLIYLAIAMRSVYGQGWISSGLKAFLGLFAFPLMLKARRGSTSLVAPLLA